MRKIFYGSPVKEIWDLNEKGQLSRVCSDGSVVSPSDRWVVLGAYRYNKLGYAVEFYSFATILAAPDKIPWKWKNGKQRTFIVDWDHGARREWRTPHEVK